MGQKMKVCGSYAIKPIGEAKPGEIIAIDYPLPSLCTPLSGPSEDNKITLGLLTGNLPFSVDAWEADELCVSYGSEWMLEPDSNSQGPIKLQTSIDLERGLLGLAAGGGWFIAFRGAPYRSLSHRKVQWWSLSGPEKALQPQTRIATYQKWRIWRSDIDRADGRSNPLVQFEATAAAADS